MLKLTLIIVASSLISVAGRSHCASTVPTTGYRDGGPFRVKLHQPETEGNLCMGEEPLFVARDDIGVLNNNFKIPKRGCHLALSAGPMLPFMGTIELGTPPQRFEALFHTATAATWVIHDRCRLNDDKLWYSGERAQFASDKSSTFERVTKDRMNVTYGDGVKLHGWWANETLMFADYLEGSRSISVTRQAVATITRLQGPEDHFNEMFNIAVVGLSFLTNTVAHPIFKSMIERELVTEPVFSFYTRHQATNEHARRQTGELIFGQIDKSLYAGEITWTPVTKRPQWQIRVNSVRVLGDGEPRSGSFSPTAQACAHGCEATINTGTNMIVGPSDEIEQLNGKLGFRRERDEPNVFTTPGSCVYHQPRNLSLVIQIQGTYLELKPEMYMFDLEIGWGRVLCLSTLRSFQQAAGEPTPWTLGAPLISNYYTIFDYGNERVGFAKPAVPKFARY